jgi:ubiquinone/menaquinone biosynthesis C-methylase UbiE
MPKREPWQVAGNAAEVYERELVPAVFGPWGPRVVELAALRPGLRVLDVACGTGLVDGWRQKRSVRTGTSPLWT